jgi:murein DD-endopeptidase MepM/ murein hydrolase activator NlpD
MYPVTNWTTLRRGYTFRQRTWYTRYHLGLDIISPAWTPVYAPFDGEVVASGRTAAQGNYVHYRADHDKSKLFRFMHLIQPGRGVGKVSQGTVIGYIGSTGMSSGNHLHVDISNPPHNIYDINLFIDPETYNWNWVKPTPSNPTPPPSTSFRVTVIEPANVRSQPKLSAPLSGSKTLNKGDVFTGVAVVKGDNINGNANWVKSSKSNYIWSGNLSY